MADRNLRPVFNSCLRNPIYMRRGYVELFIRGDHHAMPARVPICNSKTQILQHLAFQLAQNAGAFSASESEPIQIFVLHEPEQRNVLAWA
jgi:hypothetical protein